MSLNLKKKSLNLKKKSLNLKDCDLCILAGVDRCCLHGASNPSVFTSICRNLVYDTGEVGCTTIQFGDIAFESALSTETNGKVFNIAGDGDFIEKRKDEEIAKSGLEKIYCIVG